MRLQFAKGNAKLDGFIYSFSLLAGHTCPFAKLCRSSVSVVKGKRILTDGPHTQFRCFSASQEVIFPAVYKARKENSKILTVAKKSPSKAADMLVAAIPSKCRTMRIHVSGDFASQEYFDAWLIVANLRKDIIFYAYTKALPFWVKRIDKIPANFILTASYGGSRDDLIATHNLRYAKVIYSENEANGLPIDHDDSHAYLPELKNQSFCLLLHGMQPAGSEASKVLQKLKGKGSYSRKGTK